MPGVHPKVLAQGSLSLFLLYVRGISMADGNGIRMKEGPHVIMSRVFLQDLHGSRIHQSFLNKSLLSLLKSGKLQFKYQKMLLLTKLLSKVLIWGKCLPHQKYKYESKCSVLHLLPGIKPRKKRYRVS